MSTTQTNSIAKIAAVVAGLGLVAMSFASFAVPAKAATSTDLASQIAALQAQLAALIGQQGGSTGACTSFMANLTVGSKGADVSALQSWLISKGFSIPAGATGTFGAQTKAALGAYQASAGISPAVGFFGPLTRGKVNALGCPTGNGGGTVSTGSLSGNGRLTNESSLGDTTSDIKEGDSATKVVGVSFDATDGDVAVQRVDATITIGGTTGSSNLDKYVSTVAVYMNGTKLGSMDASAGDKNGRVWTFRFSGLNGVIKSGQTGNIYVEVTPISSVGTLEAANTLTAAIPNDGVRAVGSDGISDTYVSHNTTGWTSTFTVTSATIGTLTVTSGSDNPVAGQIAVASSTTSGVTLLTFNAKAKNQDVTINDLVASFGTSDNNLNDVVQTVKLMKGSTVLKSKTLTIGAYGTVTFDNVNQTISKDSTASYSIVADLKGDTAYPDGTTLIASTTVSGWDVSDSNGDTVTPSAAAIGNTQTLTATGISVAKGTPSVSVSTGLIGAGDVGTYAIPFTVTAGDNDVFISGVMGSGILYGTTTSSGSGKTDQGSANFAASGTVTGDSTTGTFYKVNAGTSRTFTLTVAYTATSTGFTGLQLTGIKYGATSGTLTSTYTSNLDTFKTADTNLVKH
jgi:fibronectin-binding autotransporter adhesin